MRRMGLPRQKKFEPVGVQFRSEALGTLGRFGIHDFSIVLND